MEDEDLPELEVHELVVLAGALRVMMMADGEVSDEEDEAISSVVRRLGLSESEWDEVWDAALVELPHAEAVRGAAVKLERTEAKDAIYELLYRLAESDSIVDPEWDFLEWLDESWRATEG